MVVPFLPPDTYFSSLTSSLTIALLPLTRNFWALTICMENLVFKWKVHSGGMFSEKVIYLPCLHRIHENFCTICSELARLFPRKRQCPGWRIQGGVANGTSKNVGLGKFWQDLEISEVFLISLEVSFFHCLLLLFLSLKTFHQRVSGSDF